MHQSHASASASAFARRTVTVTAGVCLALGAFAFVAPSASATSDSDAASTAAATGLSGLTIAQIGELLDAGTVTSAELVTAYLDRIAAYDDAYADEPGLHAVIALNPDAAAVAAERDAERAAGEIRGPLHGVPIVVKDLVDLEGMATTNGAIAFADYLPDTDSTVVARLEAAGAVIIAKTNLSEFAWSGDDSESGIRGDVRNPYDQTRTSSGSSGGTAAAVAAGFAAAGIGSDTYGSIRTPSAHQSLVGVRPTHGLVSLAGVTPQVGPLDTVGPMTVSVADAAIMLDAIAGADTADAYTSSAPVAGTTEYFAALSDTALDGATVLNMTATRFRGGSVASELTPARDEVLSIYDAAVEELRAQGATVIDVELTSEQLSTLGGRGWYGMAGYLDEYWVDAEATWPAGLAELTEPSDALTVSDYLADDREIESIRGDAAWLLTTTPLDPTTLANDETRGASALLAWTNLFAEYGAVAAIYPTDSLPATTLPLSEGYYNARNAGWASGVGAPAVTVPTGYTASGMPVGMEFMGLPFDDAELLSFAYDYEQASQVRVAPESTPALASELALFAVDEEPSATPTPTPTPTATSTTPDPTSSTGGSAHPSASATPSATGAAAATKSLASTGADVDARPVIGLAAGLVLVGGATVAIIARRRSRDAS
ncbi:amidase [Microbacterium allomyrinae]|uniref:Amidase n=1 Tax=Microbacterium allomyrinae TaxID=2830666 RepID=A0A9X1S2J9_9MICO|nr:amidase family protein [Microbacterium allomyrinae]MCC2032771.1 amidase [Microbacterium allomyrinae]